MTRKILSFFVLLALTAAFSVPALAWDSFGHMEVAYVAYQSLTPQAKARVKQLLAMNPQYNAWVSQVPASASSADKDMMVFMLAATWADWIKTQSSGYTDDNAANPDLPDGATSSQNIGYTDMFRHRYWHFVDTPFSTDGTTLPAIPAPNAQDRIALYRGVLASTSDDGLKSYDLAWILHLVGDVHQPLHCATRVSSGNPQGDAGGNNVKLNGNPNELHAVWDDLMGTSSTAQAGLAAVIKAAKKLPAADATLRAVSDEKAWIAESFEAAQQTAYHPPIGAGNGPFTLTSAYKSKAKKVAMQRVALAGARLANLINNELK